METKNAIVALAALAQETRLSIFRVLVRAGDAGLPAGAIAEAVGAPASTLSFHLKELANAGLVTSMQRSRFVYYSAAYPVMSELIAFLTEKCCEGMPARNVARIGKAVAACCSPAASPKRQRTAS
ncbi:MAG TPA: metalloregulator ArsR/SmtB family transcription factor [Usitatibacter sp.]|jgi:DNA-binding transcriptional ArsR family regulator|nr:metalloregulator ArsR/SmtB family transcription factor [Usitatibacter sp.]